ncbi:MAG: hypothetical protein HGA19_10160, partial [Oscillochloris sp.]|nr:hypothetical protein [Oscillochloris sp.]
MWSDNETATDLLGFAVHKDLVRQLVTTDHLLPLTIGVFGDWGGGKSSVMRMLQHDLDGDDYPDIACLYFNGWVFEGYDDAKSALISSILVQLGEHRRFGLKVRGRIVSLLKRVNFMRVAGQAIKFGAVPAAAWLLGAGVHSGLLDPQQAATLAAGIPAAAATLGAADPNQASQQKESEHIDWASLIAEDKSKPGPLDIRTFREDFERLISETGLRALVVLIDDLDRCSPERLIENLEAIKLFLAVPKTAFIIAADERIVRFAIAHRYQANHIRAEQAAKEEPYDLETDYLEKLIQIPYHLPRLSPSEIESYMTLLFCQSHLRGDDRLAEVLSHCDEARKKNRYLAYSLGSVQEVLREVPQVLSETLQWTSGIAPALTEGLKGNPRQVKRFLNALLLRKQLGQVAALSINDIVLVKLMLLEYTQTGLFDQLYLWQAGNEGMPPQLKELERGARDQPNIEVAKSAVPSDMLADSSKEWLLPSVQEWLRLEPPLADVDLRDYFWIARDRLTTTITNLAMVPPYVRLLFNELAKSGDGERQIVAKKTQSLSKEDLAVLLHLFQQNLQRRPEEPGYFNALESLVEAGVVDALDALTATMRTIPVEHVEANQPFVLVRLGTKHKTHTEIIKQLLERWSQSRTPAGAASKQALPCLPKPD